MTSSPQPVLITGAEGQLGRHLTDVFERRGPVVACNRHTLDLKDPAAIAAAVAEAQPAIIVNCAAYNDVDGAEEHAEEAFLINALAVRSLARAAARCGALLVHYGTDFVFDGKATQLYRETDAPSPQSVYAASKLSGEWFAPDAERWLVLRVESLFGVRHSAGTRRIGSIDKMLESILRGDPVRAFADRIVSPSYLVDVAAATCALIDHHAPWGVYHVVNSGYCTWYELAQELARLTERADASLHAVDVASVTMKAARPQYAALSNQKLTDAGFTMPTWQDALARYVAFAQSV